MCFLQRLQSNSWKPDDRAECERHELQMLFKNSKITAEVVSIDLGSTQFNRIGPLDLVHEGDS